MYTFRKTYKQKNNDRKICILLKLLECVTFIMFTFLVGSKQCVKDFFPDSFVIPSHFSLLFYSRMKVVFYDDHTVTENKES